MIYRIHKILLIWKTEEGERITSLFRNDETTNIKQYKEEIKKEFNCHKVALGYETIHTKIN